MLATQTRMTKQERRSIFLRACLKRHANAFDRASHVLDVYQASPFLMPYEMGAAASRRMLFHLREMHQLALQLEENRLRGEQ